MSSSLFEQISVMRDVVSMDLLDPSKDIDLLNQADALMKRRSDDRAKVQEDARNTLRSLTRQLESARLAAKRPQSVPTPQEHQEALNAQDTKKFSLAKSIQELEQSVAKCETSLARLREEWDRVEAEEPSRDHELDQTALRLKICRELGFEVVTDDAGKVSKVLVRNDVKNDVQSVVLEKNASAFFQSNFLWKLAGSE